MQRSICFIFFIDCKGNNKIITNKRNYKFFLNYFLRIVTFFITLSTCLDICAMPFMVG